LGNVGQHKPGSRGLNHKTKVVSLVERDGTKQSFHVTNVNAETLRPIMTKAIAKKARLMTDEAGVYKKVGKEFASHESVVHSAEEYVRGT